MDYLFYARMDAFEFKTSIDLMKDVLTEATFIFDVTKKISIFALDPDKVCHVELNLWMLEEFETTSNENITFGVFMPNLYKLLRYIKKNYILELAVSNDRKLTVVVKDDEETTTQWMVKLNPIETAPYIPRAIQFDHTISSSISSSRLATIIGSLSVLSPIVDISVKNNAKIMVFEASGPMGSGTYEIEVDKDVQIYKQRGKFEGRFYSKFIDKFCKPALNKPVEIVMAPNQPLEIAYSLDQGRLSMRLMPLQTS